LLSMSSLYAGFNSPLILSSAASAILCFLAQYPASPSPEMRVSTSIAMARDLYP
jgi:hypothetical protein